MSKDEFVIEFMLLEIKSKYPKGSHFRIFRGSWVFEIALSSSRVLQRFKLDTESYTNAVKRMYEISKTSPDKKVFSTGPSSALNGRFN